MADRYRQPYCTFQYYWRATFQIHQKRHATVQMLLMRHAVIQRHLMRHTFGFGVVTALCISPRVAARRAEREQDTIMKSCLFKSK